MVKIIAILILMLFPTRPSEIPEVEKYVRVVVVIDGLDGWAYAVPGFVIMDRREGLDYESALVHEACHIRQMLNGDRRAGFELEHECNLFQAQYLLENGGDPEMIIYLVWVDGKHGDINKDGLFDYKDQVLMFLQAVLSFLQSHVSPAPFRVLGF